MNNFGTNFNNTPMQPINQNNQYYTLNYSTIITNIELVTGLEEAIMRTNTRYSDKVYFKQDGGAFYRIKVDGDGRKSWAEFSYSLPETNNDSNNVLQELSNRVKALEDKLLKEEK